MKLRIGQSLRVRSFAQQGITRSEVEECFLNRKNPFNYVDSVNSEEFDLWFVSNTDRGRSLKITFTHTTKMSHVLQLPDKTVTIEEEGLFYEIRKVERSRGK